MKTRYLFCLFPLLLSGCGISYYHYDRAEDYQPLSRQLEFGEDFARLSLNWVSGDIFIQSGESFSFRHEYVTGSVLPTYYLYEGGKLTLQYAASGTSQKDIDNTKKDLYLTLPSSIRFLDIDAVTSAIDIDLDAMEEIRIDMVTGYASASVDSVERYTIQSVSASGSLLVDDVTGVSKIDHDTVSGDFLLTVDDIRPYRLDYSSVSGKKNLGFTEGKDSSLAPYSISFSSVSGDFTLEAKTARV